MFLTSLRVIVLPLAVLLVGACSNNADHHHAIPLFRSIPFPTGLDYWPERQILFASSYYDGSVQAVNLVSRLPYLYLKKNADGKSHAIRVKLEPGGKALWVLDKQAVFIYDAESRELLARIGPCEEDAGDGCYQDFSDIVFDRDGNAYLTDGTTPLIYIVRKDQRRIEAWLDVSGKIHFGFQNRISMNLSSIAITPDGNYLIVGKMNEGTLWKIDIRQKRISPIQLDYPILYVFGLVVRATISDGNSNLSGSSQHGLEIFALRSFANRISRIKVSAGLDRGMVEYFLPPYAVLTPTSGVLVDGVLYVVDSHLWFEEFLRLRKLPYFPYPQVRPYSVFATRVEPPLP